MRLKQIHWHECSHTATHLQKMTKPPAVHQRWETRRDSRGAESDSRKVLREKKKNRKATWIRGVSSSGIAKVTNPHSQVHIMPFFSLERLTGKRAMDKKTDWRKEVDEKKHANAFAVTFHLRQAEEDDLCFGWLGSQRKTAGQTQTVSFIAGMRWERNNWLMSLLL